MPSDKPLIQARIEPELFADLAAFCESRERQLPDTLRSIVKLFLADGHQAAADRLDRRSWDPAMTPEDVRRTQALLAEIRTLAIETLEKQKEAERKSRRPKSA